MARYAGWWTIPFPGRMLAIGLVIQQVPKTAYLCFRGARVKFSFTDRVEVPKQVLVCFLEKESVLLNLEAEIYYGLDETGTRMWQLLTTAPNIRNAYEELLTEFDVEAELLRQNLSELLGLLVDKGLLRIHSVGAESAPAI